MFDSSQSHKLSIFYSKFTFQNVMKHSRSPLTSLHSDIQTIHLDSDSDMLSHLHTPSLIRTLSQFRHSPTHPLTHSHIHTYSTAYRYKVEQNYSMFVLKMLLCSGLTIWVRQWMYVSLGTVYATKLISPAHVLVKLPRTCINMRCYVLMYVM